VATAGLLGLPPRGIMGEMSTESAADRPAGYARGRRTRDDLVAAAAAVYGDVGFDGASLREIAKRAGVTHAGLLYHFPSKEALLAAVLERRDKIDAERPDLHLPNGLGPLGRLVALAAHNERHRGIVELYVRLAAEATSEMHPAHIYFTDHYRQAREFAEEGFRALAAQGRLRPRIDPQVAAIGLIALMDGLQAQWLTESEAVDLTTALRHYIEQTLTETNHASGPAKKT